MYSFVLYKTFQYLNLSCNIYLYAYIYIYIYFQLFLPEVWLEASFLLFQQDPITARVLKGSGVLLSASFKVRRLWPEHRVLHVKPILLFLEDIKFCSILYGQMILILSYAVSEMV